MRLHLSLGFQGWPGELCHIFFQQDWVIREEHVYQCGSASHDHAPCLESSGRKLGLAHYGSKFIRRSRSWKRGSSRRLSLD